MKWLGILCLIWIFISPIEFFNKTVGSSGKDDKVYGISCLIWVYFHSHIEFLKQWEAVVGMAKYMVFHV